MVALAYRDPTGAEMDSESDLSESGYNCRPTKLKTSQKLSAKQTATLNGYYKNGMKGEEARYSSTIQYACSDKIKLHASEGITWGSF